MYQRTHQLGTGTGCTDSCRPAVDADCRGRHRRRHGGQGAGTVFATVRPRRPGAARNVNDADTEAGYFATASGSNQNPTDGFLDVEVTADELCTATSCRVGRDVHRRLHASQGRRRRPTQPPTAAFTSSRRDLTATSRAPGPRDPEGPIAVLLVGLRRRHAGRQRRPAVPHLRHGRRLQRHSDRHRRGRRHRHPDSPGHRHRSPPGPGRLRRRHLQPDRRATAWGRRTPAAPGRSPARRPTSPSTTGTGAITMPSAGADPLGLRSARPPAPTPTCG